jgi:uncharacterized protein with HEPN domain
MCIMQIGELANTLSDSLKNSTVGQIPWKQIKGMRNHFVHGYNTMNKE